MVKNMNGITLGTFRDEVNGMAEMHLVRNEPLEPLSISMPVDRVHVILGASPCIVLRFGSANVTLSHVQTIKHSAKGGKKSYRIVCGDYSGSNVPNPIEYRLYI